MMGAFNDLAEQAYLNGFEPIPIPHGHKAPIVSGWATGDITLERVFSWQDRDWGNMGLRTGRLVVLDVDITSPDLSDAVVQMVQSIAPSPIVRVGKAPKLALLYRRADDEPERRKQSSTKYQSADYSAQIEILGRGQQVVVEGVHPDTQAPYFYPAEHWDRPLADCPTISQVQIDEILKRFDALARDHGWTPINAAAGGTALPDAADPDAQFLLSYRPALGLDHEQLEAIVKASDMTDRQSWIGVGMALHHETRGADEGLHLWQRYSWDDEQTQRDCQRFWERFDSDPQNHRGTPMTVEKLPAYRDQHPTPAPAPAPHPHPNAGIVRVSDLDLAPPSFLVDGILEEAATALWFGVPASFKSFVVVDLACCVATGTAWHGHDIDRTGPVLYICGEGHAGIARRVEAWSRTHNIPRDQIDFYKTRGAMNFSSAERVQQLMHDVLDGHMPPPVLVPVDTIARNLGGDENSAEDFAALFDAIDRFRVHIPGVTFLLVGHPGLKDPKRPRGSSSQEGNVDAMVRLVREPGGRYVTNAICMKMKDAVMFPDVQIGMKEVLLGQDAKGRDYHSLSACAPEEAHRDSESVVREIHYAAMSDEEQVKAIEQLILRLATDENATRQNVKAGLGEEFPWHNKKYSTALERLTTEGLVAGRRPIKLTDAGRRAVEMARWGGDCEVKCS
jgi:hypothetical protein